MYRPGGSGLLAAHPEGISLKVLLGAGSFGRVYSGKCNDLASSYITRGIFQIILGSILNTQDSRLRLHCKGEAGGFLSDSIFVGAAGIFFGFNELINYFFPGAISLEHSLSYVTRDPLSSISNGSELAQSAEEQDVHILIVSFRHVDQYYADGVGCQLPLAWSACDD
jgi:hypothetical protein